MLCRDEALRHMLGKRNGAADGDAHRRKPAAAATPAPTGRAAPAERNRVGPLGIVAIELLDGAFGLASHAVLLSYILVSECVRGGNGCCQSDVGATAVCPQSTIA